MTYISSNDARRQDSTGEVEGFSTPAEEMFLCTCHGKRWPLSRLKIENGGQRHCSNQANRQGGSIDRDMLRDYDRIEIERRAVEDAVPVTWPITPLELIACVETIEPRSQTLFLGGPDGIFVIHGENLSTSDVVDVVSSDAAWPPAGLDAPSVVAVVATDGLSATVTCTSPARTYHPAPPFSALTLPTPLTNFGLTYNGVVYENVFLLR